MIEGLDPREQPRNPERISNTKIGIIGFGSVAQLHARILQELSQETGSSLGAIADTERSHPDQNIPSFRDYKELLDLSDVPTIIIATPPSSHFEIARDALTAGKDVFLEKPPTLTIQELQELEQLASAGGRVLFTGYHTRYRPEVSKAKEVLETESVSEIDVRYKEDVTRWHGPQDWVFDPTVAGGGILIDSGINVVSVLTYIFPDMDYKILSCERSSKGDSRVETSVKVEFEFINRSGEKGKGIIQMDGLYKELEQRQYSFKTSAHEYLIDIVQGQLLRDGEVISGANTEKRTEADLGIEYRALFRDFFEHVKRRESLVNKKELQFVLDAYGVNS